MDEPIPQPESPPELPAEINLNEIQKLGAAELAEVGLRFNIRFSPERSRHHRIFDLLKAYGRAGGRIVGEGIVEIPSDGQAFLRWPLFNFRPTPEDVQIPTGQLKRFGIGQGHRLLARVRVPQDREKHLVLEEVLEIEGIKASEWVAPKGFDHLTPLFPSDRIILEHPLRPSLSARAVDLITPLGKGQRALIVAPPRTGKTILLKEIAKAIRTGSPEIHLILLLIDERPEEVTDLKREIDADVFSSTFDESPTRHVQVAEIVSERARRLVELKKDVVILLDSITRLARGYNALQPGKGRIMSGGVESKALLKPKKFFGAARNVEEGGSLTIIATALIDTESRMDEVIFEEFKGTGNMELHLDRSLVERRVYPAIQVLNSGTRREELLYHPAELERVHVLRRVLAQLPAVEAMELLLANLKATRTNTELLLTGLR